MPNSGQRPRPLGPSPASAACRRSADGFLRAAFSRAHTRVGGFKRIRKARAGVWASCVFAPSCRRFGVPAERSRLFRSARVPAHIWEAGLQYFLEACAGLWVNDVAVRARSPASVAASNLGFSRTARLTERRFHEAEREEGQDG